MSTFTIDSDNNITAYASAEGVAQPGDPTATSFDSQATLAMATADWPLSRLVDIWNSIPGNAEVSKFQDRKKAVARIWKAIQPLAPTASPASPSPQPRREDQEPSREAGQGSEAREEGQGRQEGCDGQDGWRQGRAQQQEGRGDSHDEARSAPQPNMGIA